MTDNTDAALVREARERARQDDVEALSEALSFNHPARPALVRLAATAERADETKFVLDDAIDEVTRLKTALLAAQQELEKTQAEFDALDQKYVRAEVTNTRLRKRAHDAWLAISAEDYDDAMDILNAMVEGEEAALAQDTEQEKSFDTWDELHYKIAEDLDKRG